MEDDLFLLCMLYLCVRFGRWWSCDCKMRVLKSVFKGFCGLWTPRMLTMISELETAPEMLLRCRAVPVK